MAGQGERLPDDMPNVGNVTDDIAEVTPRTFTGVATGPLMRYVPGGVAEFRQQESGLPPVRAQLGGEEFWGQLVQPGYGTLPKTETKTKPKTELTPEEKAKLDRDKLDDIQQKAEGRMEDVEFLYEDLKEKRLEQLGKRFDQNIKQLDPDATRQKPAGMPSGEGKPEFPKQKAPAVTGADYGNRPPWIAGVQGKEPNFDWPQPAESVGIMAPTFIDNAAKDVKNFSDTWKKVGTMFFGPPNKITADDYTPQTEAEYTEARTKQRNSLDTFGKAVWDFYDATSKWMKGFSDENLYLWESQGGPNSSDPAFGPKYFENIKNLLNIVKNPENIQHQDYGNLQWLAVFNMHQLFEQFGYPALIPQTVMTLGRDLGNAFKGIGGPTWDKSGNPAQDAINLSVWGLGNAGIKTYNATLGNFVGKIKNNKTLKDSQFVKDLEKLTLNNIVEDLKELPVRESFRGLKEIPTLRDQKRKIRELQEGEIRKRLTPKRFPRGPQELDPTLVDTPPIMDIKQYEKEQDEKKGFQEQWDRENVQDKGQGTTLTTIGEHTPLPLNKEDLDPPVRPSTTINVPIGNDGNIYTGNDIKEIASWKDVTIDEGNIKDITNYFGDRTGDAYEKLGPAKTDEEGMIYGNLPLDTLGKEFQKNNKQLKEDWHEKTLEDSLIETATKTFIDTFTKRYPKQNLFTPDNVEKALRRNIKAEKKNGLPASFTIYKTLITNDYIVKRPQTRQQLKEDLAEMLKDFTTSKSMVTEEMLNQGNIENILDANNLIALDKLGLRLEGIRNVGITETFDKERANIYREPVQEFLDNKFNSDKVESELIKNINMNEVWENMPPEFKDQLLKDINEEIDLSGGILPKIDPASAEFEVPEFLKSLDQFDDVIKFIGPSLEPDE